jgi:8-oxo-dGTP pyrophosphatase MutT (NUDIX family)
VYRFDDELRGRVAARCAAFERQVPDGETVGLKQAAVAIALVEADDGSGEAAFLLTRRPATMRAHSGQYALPGGRCDPGETVVESALRELHEELGIELSPASVLGLLDDFPTRSGYLIAPVVVWAGRDFTIRANPAEIANVFRIPLAHIAGENAFEFVASPESDRQEIRALINDDRVYAPTAAIVYQFREVLAGRATRVAMLEQPRFAWK